MSCCNEQIVPTTLIGNLVNKVLYLTVNDKTISIDFSSLSTTNKQGQSIVFGPLQSVGTGQTITLDAFSTSGLPITYYSSNTNIATISGNTLTTLAEGVITIIAVQEGNDQYDPAVPVQQTLYVVEASSVFKVKYAWKDDNTIPSELEIASYLETPEIIAGSDYTINFPTIVGQKYFLILEPINEPIKTKWYANPLRFGNMGTFPETINRLNTTVGPYRVYITNYKTSFTDPLEFKKQ